MNNYGNISPAHWAELRQSGSFTAFDIETANNDPSSICQIGLTAVENHRLISTETFLVKPPSERFTFTYIHGITYADVCDAPTFAELWPQIAHYFQNTLVAAHYAYFDVNSLLNTLRRNLLPIPEFKVFDSCVLARRIYPQLPNHKLPTISNFLELELDHHDAGSDCKACANIILHFLAQHYEQTSSESMSLIASRSRYQQYFKAALTANRH